MPAAKYAKGGRKPMTEEEKARKKMEKAIEEYNALTGKDKSEDAKDPPVPPPKGYKRKGGNGRVIS